MQRIFWLLAVPGLLGLVVGTQAQEQPDLKDLLARNILSPGQTQKEVEKFIEQRIPRLKTFSDAAAWAKEAERLRQEVLAKVIYRGEAAKWQDAKTKVEWLDTIPGGPGYRLKKVRFEALPGLWIPALLYEPEKIEGKIPATLNVMGHDGSGKDVAYQQIRCINLVKRGMLALNVEWFNFGQLRHDLNYHHGRLNQLDLCGTSGLAPFYLALKRGLDVLLSHPNADPARVAVSGLSGGGWQTIYISALDTRVTLTNPVAGYSSFLTRIKHHKDLGDSEQTPCDMATVADYAHLTAMMAPRATLLTYNSKDNCCFEAGYALPPLMEAAGPFFQLYGKKNALRSHVNDVPGTHNYEIDNRQAFYRMIGDFFFPGKADYPREEIPCAGEVKSKNELLVPMPKTNATFHSLALDLSQKLPRDAELPKDKDKARARLKDVVKVRDYRLQLTKGAFQLVKGGIGFTAWWKPRLGNDWTLRMVSVGKVNKNLNHVMGKAKAFVLHDAGMASCAAIIEKLVAQDYDVNVIDPLLIGQSRIPQREDLFALLLGAVGERPLGIQVSQLLAGPIRLKEILEKQIGTIQKPFRLIAHGPRTSLIALVAAALRPELFKEVELHDSFASLKEVIERNMVFQQMPEAFCFGLLEQFDIRQLAYLAADRGCKVRFLNAGERHRQELGDLRRWDIMVEDNQPKK